MNTALAGIATNMFVSLKQQLDAITEQQGEYLPAIAETPLDGDLSMSQVVEVQLSIVALLSTEKPWYTRYECLLVAKDDFKLVIQRSTIYGE